MQYKNYNLGKYQSDALLKLKMVEDAIKMRMKETLFPKVPDPNIK